MQTDLLSSENFEGSHDLVGGVLIHHLFAHELDKGLKTDVASLVGINISPDLVIHGVSHLWNNKDNDYYE